MLAYDFPLLSMFWTMLWFFLWIVWILLLFRVFADIFRSDIGGVAKAFWVLFVVALPLLGVLVYLIANGGKMTARETARVQAQEDALQSYIRGVAGGTDGSGVAGELTALADLRDRGVIDEAEFAQQKARLLAR